ncbi:uroporphyrinogen-III synthase [Legionella sp. CNM-4043-24]|uniref:uroporphyrinogen-III synthase n=1 Tax=Legionella sp. CNM-4043-24 TaxID=3421646 RepID=UPI00403AF5F2
MNLNGLCVLNTRPDHQADALSQQIIQAQGRVIHFPTLQIEALDDRWLSTLPNLAEVDQAVFISSNAVNHSLACLKQQKIQWPATIKVIAIGQGTALSLQQHGIQVDALPTQADSEHLLMLPSLQNIGQQRILLFKGEGGRPLIADTLRERGAQVLEVCVYRRRLPEALSKQKPGWWQDDSVDIILITSQDALCNLFTMVGHCHVSHLQDIPCLVISNRLADAAKKMGMKTIVVSKMEHIVETLHQFNKGRDHG